MEISEDGISPANDDRLSLSFRLGLSNVNQLSTGDAISLSAIDELDEHVVHMGRLKMQDRKLQHWNMTAGAENDGHINEG